MSALPDNVRNMFHLLARSKKDADGWATVSTFVWPLTLGLPAELFEVQGDDLNGGKLRLTEKGKTINEYLL